MLVINTELTDNDMEVVVMRAINLPIPPGFDAKTMQTYVKFELPIPAVSQQYSQPHMPSCSSISLSLFLVFAQIKRKHHKMTRHPSN